jgi:acetylcholinesterase
MIAEDGTGDKLFRGAFMQSGSPISTGDITNGQALYDKIVSDIGCTDAEDTFKCLKETSFEVLSKAFNAIPGLGSYSASFSYHFQLTLR